MEMNRWLIIMLFHILVNGPLMIYIGYNKPINIYFYWILLIIGIIILMDVIYKLYKKKMNAWLYVYLILFIPLFIYTGYLGIMKEEIQGYNYDFILTIGIGALGYHLIQLKKKYF
jgi:hypothetical protein